MMEPFGDGDLFDVGPVPLDGLWVGDGALEAQRLFTSSCHLPRIVLKRAPVNGLPTKVFNRDTQRFSPLETRGRYDEH